MRYQYLPRNVASVTAADGFDPVHSFLDGKGLQESETKNNRAVILCDGDICRERYYCQGN